VLGMDLETVQSLKTIWQQGKVNSKRHSAKVFFIIINYFKIFTLLLMLCPSYYTLRG
jgi:hypothetical protein